MYWDGTKWVKGQAPGDYKAPTTVSPTNPGYVAPKSQDTFNYVAPEAYKPVTSQYTNDYYDALRNKYASDTQATLTSPEMVQKAKETRASMAGGGILGGSGYKNVMTQQANAITREGARSLSDALSRSRMEEEAFNRQQAEKVAQSQYDIARDKASAETQFGLGASDRDRAALTDRKNAVLAQLNVLKGQLGYNTPPEVVQRYNDLYDEYMGLEAGGDVANIDYAGNIIREAMAGQKVAPDVTQLRTATPSFGSMEKDWFGDTYISPENAVADIYSFLQENDASDYITVDEVNKIVKSKVKNKMNPSGAWNLVKGEIIKKINDNYRGA